MFSKSSLLLAVIPFLDSVFAQTPPSFVPEVDTGLNISYSGKDVQSGALLKMAAVSLAPNISIPANVSSQIGSTGLIIMMDLDASAPNGTLANSSSVTFLNWLATDVDMSTNPIVISQQQGAPYYPPSPPEFDSAHRYVFLVFQQPANFVFPNIFTKISPPITTNARLNFDLVSFAVAANLSLPVAADWISVKHISNLTASSTNSSMVPKATNTNSSAAHPKPSSKTSSATGSYLMDFALMGFLGLLSFFL